MTGRGKSGQHVAKWGLEADPEGCFFSFSKGRSPRPRPGLLGSGVFVVVAIFLIQLPWIPSEVAASRALHASICEEHGVHPGTRFYADPTDKMAMEFYTDVMQPIEAYLDETWHEKVQQVLGWVMLHSVLLIALFTARSSATPVAIAEHTLEELYETNFDVMVERNAEPTQPMKPLRLSNLTLGYGYEVILALGLQGQNFVSYVKMCVTMFDPAYRYFCYMLENTACVIQISKQGLATTPPSSCRTAVNANRKILKQELAAKVPYMIIHPVRPPNRKTRRQPTNRRRT